jgi:hypothetical protein
MNADDLLLIVLVGFLGTLLIPLIVMIWYWVTPSTRKVRIIVPVLALLFLADASVTFAVPFLASLNKKGAPTIEWTGGVDSALLVVYLMLPGLVLCFLSIAVLAFFGAGRDRSTNRAK